MSYGRYSNVYLSDSERDELIKEFPDLDKRIERLSEYIAYKGIEYKNHAATIRAWAKNGRDASPPNKPPDPSSLETVNGVENGFDVSTFFKAALEKGLKNDGK